MKYGCQELRERGEQKDLNAHLQVQTIAPPSLGARLDSGSWRSSACLNSNDQQCSVRPQSKVNLIKIQLQNHGRLQTVVTQQKQEI